MSDTVREQKQAWRRAAKDMMGLVDRESRAELDRVLRREVGKCVAGRRAEWLLGFAPMADEPDVGEVFRRWLRRGGSLAMPVWLGGSDMALRRVADWERDLRPGRAGILEPAESLPEVAPDAIDAAVIPGRFFSETCRRMGRGAGCYDRLVRGRTMRRVGVAYDFQVFPAIPASDDDEAMDIVVTPSRVIVNRNASRQHGGEWNSPCPTPATR